MRKKQQKQSIFDKILKDQKIQKEWLQKHGTDEQDPEQSNYYKLTTKKQSRHDSKITKITPENKAVALKLLRKNQSEANLSKKVNQMVELETYAGKIIQQNLNSKKKIIEINACLKQTYFFAKNNFQSLFNEEKFLIKQFNQQDPINFIKQLRKILYMLSQKEQSYKQIKSQQKQEKQKLIEQNKNLIKANQRLVGYIEQWKNYSEQLKKKIHSLKQVIKGYKQLKSKDQKEQQKSKHTPLTIGIEQKLDIKYMNRTDLVLLVKAIMSKLKAHAKDCTDKINKIDLESFEKLCNKDYAAIIRRSNSASKQRFSVKEKAVVYMQRQ